MAWYDSVRLTEQIDHEIVPFWDALRNHQFLLYRCKRCGASYWPMAYCRGHDNAPPLDEMEWAASSGLGHVFSWILVHQVVDPAYADDLPYPLVLVELDEGPIFPTRLTDWRPEDLRVGLPVEVAYLDVESTGVTLPLFRPRR